MRSTVSSSETPTVSALDRRRLIPFASAAAWIAAALPAPTRTVSVSKNASGPTSSPSFCNPAASVPVNRWTRRAMALQALRPVVDGVHRRDDGQ